MLEIASFNEKSGIMVTMATEISPTSSAERFREQPITGRMLVDGNLVESVSGEWIECVNPATEDYIGKVPRGSAGDVERAVAAAEQAQTKWVALSVAARSEDLLRLADAISARA